jgi:hypothetical protein
MQSLWITISTFFAGHSQSLLNIHGFLKGSGEGASNYEGWWGVGHSWLG